MNRGRLLKGLAFGAVAGIIGIGLFWFLYTSVLAEFDNAIRLFGAFFIPILIIGIMVVVYHFLTR